MPNDGDLHEVSAKIGELSGRVGALVDQHKEHRAEETRRRDLLWKELREIGGRLNNIETSVKPVADHETRLKTLEDGASQRVGRTSVLSAIGGGGVVMLFDWIRAKVGF
jgi:hypothetical protein